ncbi:winged helix-turn-helix domain-containing protein [Burkholderia contaminans]|uniref:RND transporter n=2 Tax=Pseudomonadota TaxID=1224 RepID=A0A6P2Z707_9BURK|nr:RND transporter [Burkholderia contaminans]
MIALRVRRRPAAVSITSVALAAALAGCTVGPDYRRPAVDTPAAWRLDPADAYWHPAAPARAPLDPAWWTAFGDPQLDALEADALRNNQNLKAVAARYDQAKATLASVASAQYPAVGLNASGQRFKISADRPQTNYATKSMSTVQNEIQVGAAVSYELDLFGRVRRSVESAQATTEQAGDDFANARLVLTANLASSYFALREFDTEIDVVKRSIDLQQKALDYVSARHDLGAVSGLDLLQQRAQKQTPVIMLTARDRVDDRVRGLRGGADDYLTKPFSFLELIERLRALTRRARVQESTLISIGDLRVDLIGRRATRDGTRLDLTAQEFQLLGVLARRSGEVLSKTTIAELVWDVNFDSNANVVETAIKRLRAKLDGPFTDKLLHTIRGMGYVLEAREDGDTERPA